MSEVWSLPGYEVQALLGSGTTGEVWRARELATGETVALQRLTETDAAAVEALRHELARVRLVDSPYVVRLRAVVDAGADPVLVLDHAAGGSLAALLVRRGSLDSGEVVTIAWPLAQALAAAHARGLVHGNVTPSNVLFTADGKPLLGDLGLARVSGCGGADAAADVGALAEVCHRMLGPSAPRALVAAVQAGLVADSTSRPDAATFAERIRRAHPAAPVQLRGSAAPDSVPDRLPAQVVRRAAPQPAHARPRRVPQGALVASGAVALIVLAGALGWMSGRSEIDPVALPKPVAVANPPSPRASSPPWAQVLAELDAARAQAFSAGEVAALAEVYLARSPGHEAESALLQALVDRRQTAHGLRHSVQSVQVLESSGDAARLRVTDTLSAYEIHDATGEVVNRAPGRGERSFVVELTRTAAGWRLVQVRPVPAS